MAVGRPGLACHARHLARVAAGLLAVAALSPLGGCSPALDWRRMPVPQSGGLTFTLPCRPDVQKRQVDLPGLGAPPVSMTLLSCHSDGVQWSLSHFDAGTIERQARAPGLLREAMWANVSAASGGQGASRRDLGDSAIAGATPHPDARHEWLSGHRPLDATRPGEQGRVQMHVWVFVHGLHVFQASATAPELREDDPRIPTYQEGFIFPR